MSPAALLVIDLQRGAFDGVRCPPIDRPDELVGNAQSLIAAARDGAVPVVFIQHCEGAGHPFEEGSDHGEFHQQLTPQAGDLVVKKHASSAFENTDLRARLLALEVTDLVVCGLQSEFCVSNTSKAALELGYRVSVAQDGHGTWPSEGKRSEVIADAANNELRSRGAIVESTSHLAAKLRTRAR